MALIGALLLPGIANATCPPPETPPIGDNFYFCFDAPHIGPQPIVNGDKGPFVVAEVELNGHKLLALLDTGATMSVVDASVAKDVGLKANGTYDITTFDGKQTQAQKAPIDQLVIGGFTRYGGPVAIADLSAMRQAARQPFAMLLGADVLSQVALLVDRDNSSLIVFPSNAKASGSDWTAPLHIRQPGSIWTTSLSVDGRAVTVKLDTGADNELALPNADWAGIVPSTAQTTTIASVGLGGLYVAPLVRLNKVRIGDKSIGDAIATQATGAASDAVLGMGILSRYTLFLNPQAGIMVLTKPKKLTPPRPETMVGIQGPPTDQGITIMHVMARSPAEAAGLKAGDHICTVDGETVSAAWEGTPKDDWMSGPEGKTVVLGRCGGGSVPLTLRRFY